MLREFRKIERHIFFLVSDHIIFGYEGVFVICLLQCWFSCRRQVTTAVSSKDKEPRPLWKEVYSSGVTFRLSITVFLCVCRKVGQSLHATASQPRPPYHRVVHDEEDGVHREEDEGEGLDVVGLDVGSQQEQQRRPPPTGTENYGDMRDILSEIQKVAKPHFVRGLCALPLIRSLLHARNCEITKGLPLEIERGAEQREGAPRPKRCYLKIAVCLEAEGMGREGQRGETYEITLWKIELLKTYFHVTAIYPVYFPIDVHPEDF